MGLVWMGYGTCMDGVWNGCPPPLGDCCQPPGHAEALTLAVLYVFVCGVVWGLSGASVGPGCFDSLRGGFGPSTSCLGRVHARRTGHRRHVSTLGRLEYYGLCGSHGVFDHTYTQRLEVNSQTVSYVPLTCRGLCSGRWVRTVWCRGGRTVG
jgi:hypothetical protein